MCSSVVTSTHGESWFQTMSVWVRRNGDPDVPESNREHVFTVLGIGRDYDLTSYNYKVYYNWNKSSKSVTCCVLKADHRLMATSTLDKIENSNYYFLLATFGTFIKTKGGSIIIHACQPTAILLRTLWMSFQSQDFGSTKLEHCTAKRVKCTSLKLEQSPVTAYYQK